MADQPKGVRTMRMAMSVAVSELKAALEVEPSSLPTEAERTKNVDMAPLRKELLELAASSNRGQAKDEMLMRRCKRAIAALEAVNPNTFAARSPLLEGEWVLVYASEDPTRCSPFFWALRRRMSDVRDPSPISNAVLGSDNLLDNVLSFTDGVPIKSVGVATQRFQGGELVNQVVLNIFPLGESKVTTTCRYEADPTDPSLLSIYVQKTQALEAGIGGAFFDRFSFPSEVVLGDSALVSMRITYLDERLRIVRDRDRESACFVFSRVRC